LQTIYQKSLEKFFNLINSDLLLLQDSGKKFEMVDFNGKKYLVIFDHELINEIGINKSNSFIRSLMFYPIKRTVGDGILTSDGEEHLRDRRIIQQAFTKEMLEKYFQSFIPVIQNKINQWRENESLDFYKISAELVLEITSRSIFNYDIFNSENFKNIVKAFPDYAFLNNQEELGLDFSMIEQKTTMDKMLEKIIIQSKFNGGDEKITSLLLKNNDPVFSEKQIKEHLANLIIAGYRTTNSLLAWCVFMISENPNVLLELQKEADECLWIKENRSPTLEEIHNNYEISRKIIKETLRVYPPVWFSVKQAKEDVDLKSINIKKGTSVVISQYIIHRNSKFFESPETWNPYRWTREFEKNLPKSSYIPFGQGSRQCIGYEFALVEIQMILLLMAKNFSWKNIKNENNFLIRPNITLQPKNNVSILLTKRMENSL